MIRTCLALLLSAAALTAAASDMHVAGEPAWDAPAPSADPGWRNPGHAAKRLALTRFAPMAPSRVEAVQRANAAGENKILMIGLERTTASEAEIAGAALDWLPSPDGGHTARLDVESPGAKALRSGLAFHALPDGATLRFAGSDGRIEDPVPGALANKLQATGTVYWSPVTEGSTQRVEIHLPAGVDPQWTRVGLPRISHLFVSPRGDMSQAKIGESGACNINASCVPSTTTGYDNAKNAVTRLVIQTSEGSGFCTATLLNDTDTATQVPLLFGAAHCVSTQGEASGVTTFWFYESTSCSAIDIKPAARQVSGGTTLLYASVGSDVSLVRMNNAPPSGAFYGGWSSAALASGASIQVLHHPRGDILKFSQGIGRGTGPSSTASGSFHKVSYSDGTTEGGSSGSGLLTYDGSQFVLRGGLLGGSASCDNAGNVDNPGNSDDFSRLDLEFANVQQFLAPAAGPPPPSNIDYTGAWNNSSQSGWGLVVIRGGSGIYAMYIYHYDQDSSPGWYLSAGALSGTAYNAGVLAFTGPWFGINPFNPGAVGNRNAGNLQVNFTSATTATISFTIDGRSVSTTLNKLAF